MLAWLRTRRRPNFRLRPVAHATRLRIEPLEDRLLLSADVAALDYAAWREQAVFIDSFENVDYTIDQVSSVGESGSVAIQNNQTTQLIGANQVWANYGYTGSGYSVAVLDTGIDYTHPNLSSQYITGWDFVDNDADPMDEHGHGTHVSGTIASNNSTYRGVGSDLGLIALRVLDANGSGSFGNVEDALQWVVDHATTYNIVAVNMSLGTGNFTTNPYTFLEDEFQALQSLGVFIAAASGNSFYSVGSELGLGFPAISPLSVSVGAVWDANVGSISWSSGARDYSTAPDRITSFTQRSSDLDILAPGALLTSTALGGGFTTMGGTSMATPVIAGSAALIYQALDANGQSQLANQTNILSIMKQTGVNIVDGDDEDDNVTNSGLNFRRIDLAAAVDSVAAAGVSADDTIGLFADGNSIFFLRDENAAGPADALFQFGPSGAGWIAVSGDWDGDGTDTVGLFDPSAGKFFLSNSNASGDADVVFRFGPTNSNWLPVVGDWDGDGDDSIGLYNQATATFFLKNSNSSGNADQMIRFGPTGSNWLPLAGDWDGDGTDTVGLQRPSDSTFFLSNTPGSNYADLMFRFGPSGSGWMPVRGDWDGDGADSIGLFDQDGSRFFLSNANQSGPADFVFRFGPTGQNWSPLTGHWNMAQAGSTEIQATEAADPSGAATAAAAEAYRGRASFDAGPQGEESSIHLAQPDEDPVRVASPLPTTHDSSTASNSADVDTASSSMHKIADDVAELSASSATGTATDEALVELLAEMEFALSGDL